MEKRKAFFLSDQTGITAENLGHALLSQFDNILFEQTTLPFVDSEEKAQHAVDYINHLAEHDGCRPIIFSTLVNARVRAIIRTANAFMMDLFDTFISPLEEELGVKSSGAMGKLHGIDSSGRYSQRIEAINFALASDDGVATERYAQAEIILVGVSRSGKTPTCLYLAMQFGVLAANYPLMEEELEAKRLPESLRPWKKKLFGLIIHPQRLSQIREERFPNSRYASLAQCQREIRLAEALFVSQAIPYIDSTSKSVEEIAATIVHKAKLQRKF